MNHDQDDAPRAIATNGAEASKTPGLPDDMLIILPVRNLVLFPGVILPVAIKREKTVAGAQEAVRVEGKVGFLLQKNPGSSSMAVPSPRWPTIPPCSRASMPSDSATTSRCAMTQP